ncbi:ribosomal protein S18 acetylase RimI-like enzyme [Flavobacterium sp. HSC-32F16]|uniref:GNAT family N-acetyltransferase n=1 Tax=Flavobacterium sp. HSC-32F16 TaxID=2910964 RepID=UPI0020A2EBA1|nr:GNAT family N-acetyltransferase [Flavobacterium sp. HSC-32F16]MCP2024943.1 ribosomal protein S18 acetylase RimI-like enzyme [Flavobacterium sp. HSC-32F16]
MEKQIKYYKAESGNDFEKCKEIIVEYLDTLGIDLAYMNLQKEFAEMKQMYGGSQGTFFYALDKKEVIGCIGVRRIETEIAELKRLYVKDSHRGYKVGVTLLQNALESASKLGYKKIRLDVIPTLQKAKQLYISFGFYEITPYFKNPVEGTTYMEKNLLE